MKTAAPEREESSASRSAGVPGNTSSTGPSGYHRGREIYRCEGSMGSRAHRQTGKAGVSEHPDWHPGGGKLGVDGEDDCWDRGCDGEGEEAEAGIG